MSLKIGYRTLNCIVHFWSLILVSIFFAWGLLKFFSKSFFVAVILSTHSYLEFVCVGCYCVGFCLSEWYNRLCENWAGVR